MNLWEKRELAGPPVFGKDRLEELPAKIDRYYTDHFTFRSVLIRCHNELKHSRLGVPTESVLIGSDGWLFFAGVRIADDYQGKTPLHDEELRRWSEELQWRRDWLASKGVAYAFVIVPNKSTVYPGHLPRALRKRAGQSRREQLGEHLREHCTADVLDLTDAMRAAKSQGECYLREDSHWNGRGVLAARQEIGRWICRRIPEAGDPPTAWSLTRCAQYGYADLRCLLGLPPAGPVENDFLTPSGIYRPTSRQWDPPAGCAKLRQEAWSRPTIIENPAGKRRLLFFCDSFGRAGVVDRLQPLADQFATTTMLVSYPTRHEFMIIVEQQRPDVVIESRAEMSLAAVPQIGSSLVDAALPATKTAELIGAIDDVANPQFLFDGIENDPQKHAAAPLGVPMVFTLKKAQRLKSLRLHLYDIDQRSYKFRVEAKTNAAWSTLLDCSEQPRSGVVSVDLPDHRLEAFRITGVYNSDQELHPGNKVLHLLEIEASAFTQAAQPAPAQSPVVQSTDATRAAPDARHTPSLLARIEDVCDPQFLFDGIEDDAERFATAPNGVPMCFQLRRPQQLKSVRIHLYDFDKRTYKFRVEVASGGKWTTVFDCSDRGRSGVVDIAMPERALESFRITGLYNSDQERRPANAVFHLLELTAVPAVPNDANAATSRVLSSIGGEATRSAPSANQRGASPSTLR